MKKFIYKIYTQEFANHVDDEFLYNYFNKNNIPYELEDLSLKEIYTNHEINSLGKAGWELVGVLDKKSKTNFYFKKEIE